MYVGLSVYLISIMDTWTNKNILELELMVVKITEK